MKWRSVWSRIGWVKQGLLDSQEETASVPISSFPFVSGDTFLQMAGVIFASDGVVRRAGISSKICFAAAPVACDEGFRDRAEAFLRGQSTQDFILIIHNGDTIPPQATLNLLGEMFTAVYCVNVISETRRLRALPIGLENARLNNNGRLDYYLPGLEQARSINRSRLVVSSFHESNNPAVREPTAELFRKSRFGFHGHSWKRKEYRDVLKETCFVISPPGNGPDCHRTWEALYMGAIPVVLKSQLANSLVKGMPILAVDSYEEFVGKDDSDLRGIYRDLTALSATKAFATHWIMEFC